MGIAGLFSSLRKFLHTQCGLSFLWVGSDFRLADRLNTSIGRRLLARKAFILRPNAFFGTPPSLVGLNTFACRFTRPPRNPRRANLRAHPVATRDGLFAYRRRGLEARPFQSDK